MKRKTTTASRNVEDALKKVREFHRVGGRSLKNSPRYSGYGWSLLKAEAEQLGMNEDTLRKARQFARFYGRSALDELLSLCRQHDFPLGRTHIISLLRMPTATERHRIQKQMVVEK